MHIGKVIGEVVSTLKHETLRGEKLLLVERMDPEGNLLGTVHVAVDAVLAGKGDTVLLVSEGRGAQAILNKDTSPVRDVIIGVIDRVEYARS